MFYSHLRRVLPPCLPARLSKLKTFIVGFMIASLCLGLALPPRQASAQSQCTVGCKATVPPIAQQNTPVTFTSEATTEGCAVRPAYEWDFGDSSPRQSAQNTSYSYPLPGIYNWKLTSSAAQIDTVAGGLGENGPAKKAPFVSALDIATDPKGRGFYVADSIYLGVGVRFVNTTTSEINVGGQKIAAGAVQRLVGGGISNTDNLPGRQFDATGIISIVASPEGDLLYLLDNQFSSIRVYNASNETKTVCDKTLAPGTVVKYDVQGLSSSVSSIAVNPVDGGLYVADATAGANKVYKVSCGTLTAVAGNGANTRASDAFTPGAATSTPLLQPRAIVFDPSGNLYVADTGHARVIKVDTAGQASLVHQFVLTPPQTYNPFPNGLAFTGGNLYAALGNSQAIIRLTGQAAIVAGTVGTGCTYNSTECGDGGAGVAAQFNLNGSTGTPPIAGIDSDANGLFIPDQVSGPPGLSRVRYLNLSTNTVTIADTVIAPGRIDTVAGSGLPVPFDGGLAIGGSLNNPSGVVADANGNLFISDTGIARLRFVNRGATAIKLFAGTPAEQTVQPGYITTLNKNVGSGPTDGVPVNQAGFDTPQGLKTTSQGLFITDSKKGPAATGIARRTGLIRFLNTGSESVTFYPNSATPIVVPPGNVATIAGGSANSSHNGDGQPATLARFLGPTDVAVHPTTKDIYVATPGDKAVRKINGAVGSVSSLALPQSLYVGLAFDKEGRLHVTDVSNGVVLRETSSGSGVFARLNPESQRLLQPRGIVVDASGNAYVSEVSNLQTLQGYPGSRIARISPDGQVSTVAGKHEPGFEGDGGPALGALVSLRPDDFNIATVGNAVMVSALPGISLGADGDLFFTDSRNQRIRRVTGLDASCSQTGRITVGGNNPFPNLSTLSPNTARVNSSAFRLTVLGSNFVAESKVRWKGAERPTTRISSTQLQAEIPATDLATAGDVEVTVFSPAPGGGSSAPRIFVVQPSQNPVPVLQSIEPAAVLAGSGSFAMTVRGERFTRDSIVRWNNSDLRTVFVSDKELTAIILSDFITKPTSVGISVFTPTPGGGVSARLNLVVRPNSEPKLTSLDPLRLFANSLAGTTYEITALGEAFVQTSSVLWNGVARPARFVSDKQLKFTITNEDVKLAGGASVSISNVASGGAVSNPLSFTILASPEIRVLNPIAVRAGGAGFTLGISGRNFTGGVEASIGGKLRRTIFINTAELQVVVEAEDIANPGLVSVVVLSAPSGQLPRGVSNAVNLQVVSTTGGNLTSVSAASFASGPIAPDSIVAAFGTGLASGTDAATTVPLPTSLRNTRVVVKDSAGTDRDAALFFVSPTQINYLMPAGTANGVATVTVITDGNAVASGIAEIANVVPALFTANATGEGLVSGVALRVGGNGAPSFEPILSFDQTTQKFVATPVDLGATTDQVYLIFFGTGLRNRSTLTAVKAQVGGEDVAVSFAGAAPGLFGVDQINLGPLPRSLAGRGTINVVVTMDGKTANTVQLAIK